MTETFKQTSDKLYDRHNYKLVYSNGQEDSEVGDYVKQLESSKDSSDIPEMSGEILAREVERFLRRNPEV